MDEIILVGYDFIFNVISQSLLDFVRDVLEVPCFVFDHIVCVEEAREFDTAVLAVEGVEGEVEGALNPHYQRQIPHEEIWVCLKAEMLLSLIKGTPNSRNTLPDKIPCH